MKILLILSVIASLRHLNHAYPRMLSMPEMPEYDAMLLEMQIESMGYPDPKVGEIVAKMGFDSGRNPEEMGTYYQGDILAPMDLMKRCEPAKIGSVRRWFGAKVPYTFHENIAKKSEKELIKSAMREIEKYTCVCFVKRKHEKDYVEINNNATGCWSEIGRICGKQELNLDSRGCLNSTRTPMHELMHALGVAHEQSRKDRDSYIRIQNSNINHEISKPRDFIKFEVYDGFGTPYDYGSIMHYSLNAFSINNKLETIEPITRLGMMSKISIGTRNSLSRSDIYKINHLYGCNDAEKYWLPHTKKHQCPN